MLWLVVFLAVAAIVSARQTAGVVLAAEVGRLREERAALEAQRAALEREIRIATSRRVLGARAEAELGFRDAQRGEIFILPSMPIRR